MGIPPVVEDTNAKLSCVMCDKQYATYEVFAIQRGRYGLTSSTWGLLL